MSDEQSEREWLEGMTAWDRYWDSLTPEQQRQELRSMDLHVSERRDALPK